MGKISRISSIDIVYENCDTIPLKGDSIVLLDLHINGIEKDDLSTTVYLADKFSITIDLSRVPQKYRDDLKKRKDITNVHLLYGRNWYSVKVIYPCYFYCWRPNPYQNNYVWREGNMQYDTLDIDIEKYTSLLSIKEGIKDYFCFMFHNFPNGLLILLDGYWETFKRFFKFR